MDKSMDKNFSVSDAESRRPGGVVPAPRSSSSCDGPQTSGGLPTGPPVGHATAVVKLERIRAGGPPTTKASTSRSNPREVPILDSEDDAESVCSSASMCSKSSKRKMSTEDTDTDGRHEPKGSKSRKVSILSGADFEGYDSDTSDASVVRRVDLPICDEIPKNTRRSKRGLPTASSSDSSSTLTPAGEIVPDLNVILHQDPRQVILDRLTNDELQRLGCLGLDSIEETRRASVNSLQGGCSGRLKKRGALLREVLNALHERMEGSQDSSSSFLKMRVNQISSQMRKLQSDFDSLRQDHVEAKETIRSLSAKLGKAEEENRRLKRQQREGTYLAPKPLPSISTEDVDTMRPPPPPSLKNTSAKRKDKTRQPTTSKPSYSEVASSSSHPKPRITEDRRVNVTIKRNTGAAQETPPATQREWQTAGNKKQRKKKSATTAKREQSRSRSRSRSKHGRQQPPPPPSSSSKKKKKRKGDVVKTRRIPKTAAITITDNRDPMASGKLLAKARQEIDLAALGIEGSRIRRAATGGIVIEIGGAEREDKADTLAKKLKSIYNYAITVARPVIKGELRILGLDESITPLDIKELISREGSCRQVDVTLGEFKRMSNGMFMVWAKCPLQSAVAMTSKRKLTVGWTEVRAELLRARPRQCYRCWQYGHLAATCPSGNKCRVECCFNCGGTGHHSRTCSNAPHCVLCADRKLDAKHRLGSTTCAIEKKTGIRVDFRKSNNPPPPSDTEDEGAGMDVAGI